MILKNIILHSAMMMCIASALHAQLPVAGATISHTGPILSFVYPDNWIIENSVEPGPEREVLRIMSKPFGKPGTDPYSDPELTVIILYAGKGEEAERLASQPDWRDNMERGFSGSAGIISSGSIELGGIEGHYVLAEMNDRPGFKVMMCVAPGDGIVIGLSVAGLKEDPERFLAEARAFAAGIRM